jgi:hypothetical protein
MGDHSPLFHMETSSGTSSAYDPKAAQYEAAVVNSYRDSSPERDAYEAEDDDVMGAPPAQSTISPSRGRTNRKRSNATQSYVCVVVWLVKPAEDDRQGQWVWNEIQDVRRRYDQAYSRWTPHVTLIPPFVVPFSNAAADEHSPENGSFASTRNIDHANDVRQMPDGPSVLKALSKRIANVCQRFTAQPIVFEEVSKFPLRRYDTYHLRPNAHDAGTMTLVQLQEAIAHALPEAIQYSRSGSSFAAKFKRRQSYNRQPSGLPGTTGTALPPPPPPMSPTSPSAPEMLFKPHLTLGQATQKQKAMEIEQLAFDLVTRGKTSHGSQGEGPLRVNLDAIQLMFKPIQQSGPYDVFQTFSLRTPLTEHFVQNPDP